MFTLEIKINGTMVGHIYGHNESAKNCNGETRYYFEYCKPETRKIYHGDIFHKREDGIEKLISKILEEYANCRSVDKS